MIGGLMVIAAWTTNVVREDSIHFNLAVTHTKSKSNLE